MKVIDKIALVLVIIGAINWGLVGIFNFNLVNMLFLVQCPLLAELFIS